MIEVESRAWLLKGTGDTIAASFYGDGVLVDPGVVTVDVAYAGGGTPITARATSGTGANPRTVALTPAETANLDILTLTWHATISAVAMGLATTAEIVGAHLFTIAEARTFDKAQLSNATKYPASAIAAARARIGEAFAKICGVSFVPRFRLETLNGQTSEWQRYGTDPFYAAWGGGCGDLPLPDARVTTLRSVATRAYNTATWTAYTVDQLAALHILPTDAIGREDGAWWPVGRQNVRVGYEAGYAAPPEDIRRAAKILLVDQLVTKDITDRSLSLSNEIGTFRIATAGERGSYFGLPLVDSVLDLYTRERVPTVR